MSRDSTDGNCPSPEAKDSQGAFKQQSNEHREHRYSSFATAQSVTLRRDSEQIGYVDMLHDTSDLALSGTGKRKGSGVSVGKVGLKIQKLPRLPFADSSEGEEVVECKKWPNNGVQVEKG